jgi:hypothetical protein
VRVHHVERHLHRVERDAMRARDLQHVEVDARVLVSGEADVAQLAGALRVSERGVRAFLVGDAVRIIVGEALRDAARDRCSRP